MNLNLIYTKLHAGERLSDIELAYGIDKFTSLDKDLRELGPHFFLAWQRVFFDLQSLIQMAKAREKHEMATNP